MRPSVLSTAISALAILIFATAASATKPARGPYAQFALPRAKPAARPALPFFYISPLGTFRFHYDTTGTNAVPKADANGNHVPDWVETAANIADHALHVYGTMGYDTTLHDNGTGGDSRYDIYMEQINAYGITWGSSDGYMEIHKDFINTANVAFASHGVNALSVTLTHEMFHSIQFKYVNGTSSSYGWWEEMTATFMEEVQCDSVNDYYQYLDYDPVYFTDPIYKDPRVGLDSFPNGNSVHPYSAVVFLKYLYERYGSEALTAVHQTLTSGSFSPASVESAIETATNGVKMESHLADFWVWSYFTDTRWRPEFFKEGAHYRPAPLEVPPYADVSVANISTRGIVADSVTMNHLGAWLVRIPPDGSQGSVVVRVTPKTYTAKWAWRIAVTTPAGVSILTAPAVVWARSAGTASTYEFVLNSTTWTTATDIVLIAANGVTDAGASCQFKYEIAYQTPTAIASDTPLPTRTTFGLPSPNPFNAQVTVPFALDRAQSVRLDVHDATGRPVRTLLADTPFEAGYHTLVWDGRTDAGRAAGSGVYFLRLSAGGTTLIRAVTLLR